MVVEQALPALVPGLLLGLHHALQSTRPRMGHGTDRGARHTPWILGGMAVLALGSVLAALATVQMGASFVPGLLLAVLGFTMIGLGVSAAGTSLLALLAKRVADGRQAGAATVVWVMMIMGFIVTRRLGGPHAGAVFGPPLAAGDRHGGGRCLGAGHGGALGFGTRPGPRCRPVPVGIPGPAGLRPLPPALPPTEAADALAFKAALAAVWADPVARRFSVFVFLSDFALGGLRLTLSVVRDLLEKPARCSHEGRNE